MNSIFYERQSSQNVSFYVYIWEWKLEKKMQEASRGRSKLINKNRKPEMRIREEKQLSKMALKESKKNYNKDSGHQTH